METFAQQYGGELCRQLNRPVRSATPSDSTFRRVLEQCDFIVLTRIFRQWAAASVPLSEAEWVAIDGKSIKGTMKDYASAQQNFCHDGQSVWTSPGLCLCQ
ncbi:MAG: transposase family protein [Leptolyngbya sp. SIOISBB]|nr:transposase family protein [Leptolyngbya sp. SIOISBB]